MKPTVVAGRTILALALLVGGAAAQAFAGDDQQAPTSSAAPTVNELAELYARVGRQLSSATKRDADSTFDLWPRYRWIRFMEAATTPAKREAAAAILQRLQADLKAREP